MLEFVVQKIFDTAIKGAGSILSDAVKRKNKEQLIKYEQTREKDRKNSKPKPISAKFKEPLPLVLNALQEHVQEVQKWSKVLKFSDLQGVKTVAQVYVELDTYLMPLNTQASEIEKSHLKPLLQAIKDSSSHCVILGTAGAGKTTSLQKICADGFSNGKIFVNNNFPLLIKLRTLADSSERAPLTAEICRILALHTEFIGDDETKLEEGFLQDVKQRTLIRYIDDLNAAILLDGFDELPSESLKANVEREIAYLLENLKNSKILITSRSSDFRYKFAELPKYEIAPLKREQIQVFAERWIQSKEKASDFLKKVFSSPFADAAMRPLTVAHLCAIYERIQDIPEKPKSVYRRVVQLLLEDWDSQRQIKRPSAYANFDTDRKFEVLAHLAYYLTADLHQLRFSHESLRKAYIDIHKDHGLPEAQGVQVVGELESHSGLILESGHGHFEFAHKSIQEYLAADYIVRLPSLSLIEEKAHLLPNELAIATSLSSRPASFLVELFLKVVDLEKKSSEWLATYLLRLAQEKPDLQIGKSTYSAIVVLHLISRSDAPNELAKLLSPALPPDTLKLISIYYHHVGKDVQYSSFRRSGSSRHYRLPDQLRIPTSLFQLLS
ncbi:putative NACHT family NTPase [Variovorax sp. SG517]|uniref:NACHT domain-containing protein n=1 Tax=Variovorax sp. SG517 TaxID=2587117 RepID=UPI00159DCCCD|nr:NACHT domain-containing protein [Variovorax sp. SG517]NVM87092.1 putative NACHT family NTPase [Variovorax sp. SG517]